jgi:hypothetical protein
MYRGKDIRIREEVFVFASDHQGGHGLCAKGVVTSVARGPGIRVSIKVRPIAKATRKLGRSELKAFVIWTTNGLRLRSLGSFIGRQPTRLQASQTRRLLS